MMTEHVYLNFPDEDHYKRYLLRLRWNKYITCPFCDSIKTTKLKSDFRYHCNRCNTSYSLTVNTVMHNTKVDLRKWLIALYLYLNDEKLSYRKLSEIIKVNKNTAYRMIRELQQLFSKRRLKILRIAGLNKDSIEVMSLMLLIDMRRKN